LHETGNLVFLMISISGMHNGELKQKDSFFIPKKLAKNNQLVCIPVVEYADPQVSAKKT
jgi:hypothetical protein